MYDTENETETSLTTESITAPIIQEPPLQSKWTIHTMMT